MFYLAYLKEAFFGGKQTNHFSENWLQLFLLVIWPRELVRSKAYCLENIFIIYHVVIQRLEKFLQAYEVQLETFEF